MTINHNISLKRIYGDYIMITLSQIQTRIAEAITQSGMKQTELAKQLRVTQSAISHIVNGDILPALDTLANLCKILDVDANYILCLE